ncbi:hypothetical protein ACQP1U_13495 [Actinomycetota bacterium]
MPNSQQPPVQIDPDTGVQLVPGDMPEWSDFARLVEPAALRPFVAGHAGRVLLAGPVSALLLGAIDAERVDVVLRGRPDAEAVVPLLGGRGQVYCGSVDGFAPFAPADGYDLVVALGGPDQLCGTDTTGLTDAELLRLVAGFVGADGRLVAGANNGAGLQHLVSADPRGLVDDEDAWQVGGEGYARRGLFLAELDTALGDAGLAAPELFGVYPHVSTPRFVASAQSLRTGGEAGSLARSLGARLAPAVYADRPLLGDPADLLDRTLESGLGLELAPGWLVWAARSQEAAVPDIALSWGESEQSPWAQRHVVARSGEHQVSWLGAGAPDTVGDGLRRDLMGAPVPAGELLEVLLRRECAARSHVGIRRLVVRYAEWVRSEWQETGRRVVAIPAGTVVLQDGSLALADPSWRVERDVSGTGAFVAGLLAFARGLEASAAPHPWNLSASADTICTSMAAMAGHVVTETDLADAATLLSELTPAGLVPAGDLPVAGLTGYRELLALVSEQALELREQQSRLTWLEGHLRRRDRENRDLEKTLRKYSGSISYKAFEASRRPRQKAKRVIVAQAKKHVSTDTFDRARSLRDRIRDR